MNIVSYTKQRRHFVPSSTGSVHEGIRRFGCKFCDNSFIYASHLKHHILVVHHNFKNPKVSTVKEKIDSFLEQISFLFQSLYKKNRAEATVQCFWLRCEWILGPFYFSENKNIGILCIKRQKLSSNHYSLTG